MGQDSGGPPPPTATAKRSALSADEVRVFAERAPRCTVALAGVVHHPRRGRRRGVLEAELVNVSSSGMLIASAQPLPIGAVVEFQFKLDDGLVALSGRAEVVRTVASRRGHGSRFVSAGRRRRASWSAFDRGRRRRRPRFRPRPGSRRPRSSSDTDRCACGYGRDRELLHLQPAAAHRRRAVASCRPRATSPGDRLSDGHLDDADRLLVRCKAKVAAKQDRRIGLRFIEVERSALQAAARRDREAVRPPPTR